MPTDYSIMKNRSDITDRLMGRKYTNNELTHIFIRTLAYMEATHPDRQTFWDYLEKITQEKEAIQLSLQTTEKQTVINPDFTTSGIVSKILLDNPKAI
jgi:hypothetical protein